MLLDFLAVMLDVTNLFNYSRLEYPVRLEELDPDVKRACAPFAPHHTAQDLEHRIDQRESDLECIAGVECGPRSER